MVEEASGAVAPATGTAAEALRRAEAVTLAFRVTVVGVRRPSRRPHRPPADSPE